MVMLQISYSLIDIDKHFLRQKYYILQVTYIDIVLEKEFEIYWNRPSMELASVPKKQM